MHSKSIIRRGLSGKRLRKSASVFALTRRMSPGAMGPPLITSTPAGRQSRQTRSSRPRIQAW